jgi:hypothetical protein
MDPIPDVDRKIDRRPRCAQRAWPAPPTMSKKKRAQKAKPSHTSAWSDLEQAFFAAAPPDEPQPPDEALRFDDLGPVAAAGAEMPPWLRRALDEVSRLGTAISTRVDRRLITIAIATVMLLIGLSAAVFARH